MTLRIAAESPLQSNEQLYTLNESRGTIELCDFTVVGVNRISVVGMDGGGEATSEVSGMVAAIRLPVWWTIAWEHHENGDYRIRCLHFQRKLEKFGYEVLVVDGLGLARLSIADPDEITAPPGVEWGRVASFLVAGEALNLAEFSRPPFRATMVMAARTHRLQPSVQFIGEFSASARTLFYSVDGACDGTAWTIVTKLSVGEILSNRPAETLYRNKLASQAWRVDSS